MHQMCHLDYSSLPSDAQVEKVGNPLEIIFAKPSFNVLVSFKTYSIGVWCKLKPLIAHYARVYPMMH
jgi:hypothetical protein